MPGAITAARHCVHLWLHLIFKANHEGKEFLWNGKTIDIKRGQIITGRSKLSLETGINESNVERILNYFKNEQQIEQQSFSKFRLITIKKYGEYQKIEQENEQQMNSRRTADEQQMNTNKNVRIKELKNEKKREGEYEGGSSLTLASPTPSEISELFFQDESTQENTIRYFMEMGVPVSTAKQEILKFISYWTEPNKSGTRQRWQMEKTFDVKRRLVTWFQNIRFTKGQINSSPKGIEI